MQPEFWHKRWEHNQIGFHLEQVSPHLQRFWPDLALPVDARVLVPLLARASTWRGWRHKACGSWAWSCRRRP